MINAFGIISSFGVLCGNATYSEQLAQGVEKRGYKVSRIAVPERIQKENDRESINEIIKQANQCSMVNIQMELGLYGSNPNISSKNLARIISSISVPATITIHSVVKKPDSYLRMVKNTLTSETLLNGAVIASKAYLKQLYLYRSHKRIFKKVRKGNFRIITHTHRDKKILKKYYRTDSLLHPILWPKSLVTNTSDERSHFGIEVGIFGFISPHKNFSLVVDAFSFLLKTKRIPEDSRLVIYGGHHPEAPGYGKAYNYALAAQQKSLTESDIRKLGPTEALNLLMDKRKIKNVDWIVGAGDCEMANAISKVDVCVIPYSETGQSGSGITSQSIQFAKKLVMSDTKMTQQHQKLCDKKIIIFDSGSNISLATAILRALDSEETPRFKDEYSYEQIIDIMTLKDQSDSKLELNEE